MAQAGSGFRVQGAVISLNFLKGAILGIIWGLLRGMRGA